MFSLRSIFVNELAAFQVTFEICKYQVFQSFEIIKLEGSFIIKTGELKLYIQIKIIVKS